MMKIKKDGEMFEVVVNLPADLNEKLEKLTKDKSESDLFKQLLEDHINTLAWVKTHNETYKNFYNEQQN